MANPDRLDQLRIDRSEHGATSAWLGRLVAFVVGVAGVGLATWWFLAGAEHPEVETATVVEASVVGSEASVLDASGYVVARLQATVASKITGRLVEVSIEEGMSVQEGQILARLDDANARQMLRLTEARVAATKSALNEIEVRLREAERKLHRSRALAASGVASRSELDLAQAERDSLDARLTAAQDEVKVAEQEVALRRQDVEDTLIRAPFEGVAVSKDAQPGEVVSPVSAGGGFTRTGIGTIVDMKSLEIEVDVNESFIQRVRAGQPVLATLQAYPDWTLPGRVITTVPAADRQKATVKVRIALDQASDSRILPEMGVKVAFQVDPDSVRAVQPRHLVSRRAVRRDDNDPVVFVVNGDRVERRTVSVAGSGAELVELKSGVRAGERLVLDPTQDLTDGSRVRLRERERE